LEPVIAKGVDVYLKLYPFLEKGYDASKKGYATAKPYIDKYYTAEIGELFFGLVLLFFGGHFAMSIAAWTALKVSSLKTMQQSWAKLKTNYQSAMMAAQEDEAARAVLDTDGDGKVSAKEAASAVRSFMGASAADKMKTLNNLRAILIAVDPHEVMNGMVGIWTAICSVVAALRSSMAAAIAMGVSLGETLRIQGYKYVKPLIDRQEDKDMKRWAEFGYGFVCKSIAIAVAFALARMVSAFHSAVKGGQIIANILFRFMSKKGLLPPNVAETLTGVGSESPSENPVLQGNTLYLLCCYALALYGFITQLRAGFILDTWYLRMVLLPFTIVEGILTWVAYY
jgi:hypothetical protein